jgi:transcriptional regulator with XRE-family HTH domain
MDLVQLAETLRCRRQQRGLTVEQLAEWCGISVQDLTLLEAGEYSRPSLPLLARLAEALGYPSALALLADRPGAVAPAATAAAAEQFLKRRSD